jgi:hypothetical protein
VIDYLLFLRHGGTLRTKVKILPVEYLNVRETGLIETNETGSETHELSESKF